MWRLARDIVIDRGTIPAGTPVLNIYQVDDDTFSVSVRHAVARKLRVRAADLTMFSPTKK